MKKNKIIIFFVCSCLFLSALLSFTGCSAHDKNKQQEQSQPELTEASNQITFSDEEISYAVQRLIEAGVYSREEAITLDFNSTVTRADFIKLIVTSAGLKVPPLTSYTDNYTWYAPYVQAGYSYGIFPDSGRALTFLPTDGFYLGYSASKEMYKPINVADAAAILTHMYGNDGLLFPEGFSDYIYAKPEDICLAPCIVAASRILDLTYEPKPAPELLSLEEYLAEGRISHAAGTVMGSNGEYYSLTNSMEALVNSYKKGYHLIELDFKPTSDGHFACIHGWNYFLSSYIVENYSPTFKSWTGYRIYDEFHPLFIENIASFMYQHPDFFVVADVKNENINAAKFIAENFPELKDRFIFQIYKNSEYSKIAELGYKNIIYIMYDLSEHDKHDFTRLKAFAKDNKLLAFSFDAAYLDEAGYVESMLQTGPALLVYTINDEDEIQTAYDRGILAVYTDNVY